MFVEIREEVDQISVWNLFALVLCSIRIELLVQRNTILGHPRCVVSGSQLRNRDIFADQRSVNPHVSS
jgi:hypothetical protein